MNTLATCISKGITPFGRRSIQPDGIDNMRSVSEKWDIASNLPHVSWLVNPIFFGPGPASAEHRGAPSTIQSSSSGSARNASGHAVQNRGAVSYASGCNQVISGSCDSWPLATGHSSLDGRACGPPFCGGTPPATPPLTPLHPPSAGLVTLRDRQPGGPPHSSRPKCGLHARLVPACTISRFGIAVDQWPGR